MTFRPRRSVLYMPGANARALEKAREILCDAIIFDLEDSVAPEAARAGGLDIIDGVYNDLDDAEGFMAECRQGRELGMDGKTLIHPCQVAPCNAAFSPSEAEFAHARAIVAAFEAPEAEGKGVLRVNGRMVERLHADMARRTLALAEAL